MLTRYVPVPPVPVPCAVTVVFVVGPPLDLYNIPPTLIIPLVIAVTVNVIGVTVYVAGVAFVGIVVPCGTVTCQLLDELFAVPLIFVYTKLPVGNVPPVIAYPITIPPLVGAVVTLRVAMVVLVD